MTAPQPERMTEYQRTRLPSFRRKVKRIIRRLEAAQPHPRRQEAIDACRAVLTCPDEEVIPTVRAAIAVMDEIGNDPEERT